MPAAVLASVALCTFNGEAFLARQLDSIKNQSRAVDEIIICDDRSEDRTPEIVLAFATDANVPVKWFHNPTRLGVTKNFEKAISLCSGEFIFLCDQDDVWARDKVATLLNNLQHSSAAMAFSNAAVVGDDLSPLGYRLWDSIWFDAAEQRRMKAGGALPVLLKHAIAAGSTLVFRSKYLPLILPIPDLPNSHDIWITQLLACVGAIEPVDRDLIQYRLHGANQVGMRKFGLLDQIRMARHQIKSNTFDYLARLNQAMHDRLESQQAWPAKPGALELLREKIRHSEVRHQLPTNRLTRLGIIANELRRANYRKYSYGFKSVLQDLFLR
jgi:glycosyltransferase involved in cell wall biosynthesis